MPSTLAHLFAAVAIVSLLSSQVLAQGVPDSSLKDAIAIEPQRIFILLFLMIGPIKILHPFVEMTQNLAASLQRRIALRAAGVSAGSLFLAGVLGPHVIANFHVPLPVLALAGGLILSLVALNTILEQFYMRHPAAKPSATEQTMRSAISRLAFPTIVSPPGAAAVIVFSALARDDVEMLFSIAGMIGAILFTDWLAMIFSRAILKWATPVLEVFSVTLGVVQVAIGLQFIIRSLSLLGILSS